MSVTRRLAFHVLDRRNDFRAVKCIAYSADTDEAALGGVDWEWFDGGIYACCDYHRAHALYGFGNPDEPEGLVDLPDDDGDEQIVVERIVDLDSGATWSAGDFPHGGSGDYTSVDLPTACTSKPPLD